MLKTESLSLDLINKIRSKHVSVPVLAMGIATRTPLALSNVPRIEDVKWMLEVAHCIGDHVQWRSDNHLKYSPKLFSKSEEINICHLENPLRQSILLAPLAHFVKNFKMKLPTGDDIGRRSLQGYFDILENLGYQITLHKNVLEIQKLSIEMNCAPKTIHFPVTSTGLTLTTLSIISNHQQEQIELKNHSKDPEVIETLRLFFRSDQIEQETKKLRVTFPLLKTVEGSIPTEYPFRSPAISRRV